MRFASHLLCTLLLSAPLLGQEIRTFRQWLGGEEAGTIVLKLERNLQGERFLRTDRIQLARLGVPVSQDYEEATLRSPDGALAVTWSLRLASEPLRGDAAWSPQRPGTLTLRDASGPLSTREVPAGAELWPPDHEARLKAAARRQEPLRIASFSYATRQWNTIDLTPDGPDPLPGFPDAVRFRGLERRDGLAVAAEVWISPTQGELRTRAELMGVPVLVQRSELPPPLSGDAPRGLFAQTLKPLTPHPFLPWLEALTVRFTGTEPQSLPEDPQQRRLSPRRYCLLRAAPPTPAEARDLPVQSPPSPEEASYLAPTPLVNFRDPAFEGLRVRLGAPRKATRWDLARRVTRFVFEWIDPKDMGVGFASAQEVARNARGDCTEHGVLAVALLRSLGVPARGVVGWVALGDTLGLHFWVEASVGGRWIPLDPTFDQAPASAFRLKLGTTDLADLGTVGWDSAATVFGSDTWRPEDPPEGPWDLSGISVQDETLRAPGGVRVVAAGGRWRLERDGVFLDGAHRVSALPRPVPSALTGLPSFQSSRTGLRGWWDRRSRELIVTRGDRWLQLTGVDEPAVTGLLDRLRLLEPGS